MQCEEADRKALCNDIMIRGRGKCTALSLWVTAADEK